jgi:hypothetical protein
MGCSYLFLNGLFCFEDVCEKIHFYHNSFIMFEPVEIIFSDWVERDFVLFPYVSISKPLISFSIFSAAYSFRIHSNHRFHYSDHFGFKTMVSFNIAILKI